VANNYYGMSEGQNSGWVINVAAYAEWYGLEPKQATKELTKACMKLGFSPLSDFKMADGLILSNISGDILPVYGDGLVSALHEERFANLSIERVHKKNYNGYKARIYKSDALKNYIDKVLKPDNSKAA